MTYIEGRWETAVSPYPLNPPEFGSKHSYKQEYQGNLRILYETMHAAIRITQETILLGKTRSKNKVKLKLIYKLSQIKCVDNIRSPYFNLYKKYKVDL